MKKKHFILGTYCGGAVLIIVSLTPEKTEGRCRSCAFISGWLIYNHYPEVRKKLGTVMGFF